MSKDLDPGASRQKIYVGATVVSLALFALVLTSPIAMGWLGAMRRDWGTLSDVGQTYGLASALLAGIALITVGLTLFQQSRQVRIAQLQAARIMHFELFKMAYEYPDLRIGWGSSVGGSYSEWRQRTYTNLVFKYLQSAFAMGDIKEPGLRRNMSNRFKTQWEREFWAAASSAYRTSGTSRAEKRFHAVTEQEYRRALQESPRPSVDGVVPAKPDGLQQAHAAPAENEYPGRRRSDIAIAFSAGAMVASAVWIACKGRRRS